MQKREIIDDRLLMRSERWKAVAGDIQEQGRNSPARRLAAVPVFDRCTQGHLVHHELALKLGATNLEIHWHDLRASDISGRAHAFRSPVNGGMDVEQTATLSGDQSPKS